jgi:hypothetical protein
MPTIPVKIPDVTLEAWNRLRRPSDFATIARELGSSKQLIYDAFYRRQTSERVYAALHKFYAQRGRRMEEQLRRARLLNDNYETSTR